MWIVRHRNIFFTISAVFVGLSLAAVLLWGLRLSIDFTGGSLIELACNGTCDRQAIDMRLQELALGNYSLRPTETGFLLRTPALTDEKRKELSETLADLPLTIVRSAEVGPTIGTELRRKALIAIALVSLAIVLFIAFVFREVSRPVASWKYGVIAIVALLHDILIPVGLFAFLGAWFGAEVDVLFVMALLAILGYSVNDTIVVFDRVRERLKKNQERKIQEPFEETVGEALSQTITRSINTSLTTLIVLLALFFLGAETTRFFALTLIAGVIAGTYSSIFLASPLLVTWAKWQHKKNS